MKLNKIFPALAALLILITVLAIVLTRPGQKDNDSASEQATEQTSSPLDETSDPPLLIDEDTSFLQVDPLSDLDALDDTLQNENLELDFGTN